MTDDTIYFSTGIPTLDDKFYNGGVEIGSWIGFVGEPGSMKSLTCIHMAGGWLQQGDDNCVIFVTTETNKQKLKMQMADFYDLEWYYQNNRFVFVDLFSMPGVLAKNTGSDMILSRKVIEALRGMETHLKATKGRVLLVIDSLAPLWQKMPSMSRTMFSTISNQLRDKVDMCVVTLQLAIGTDRGFGFGAEHGIDVMIRTGLYYKEGQRSWINVSKSRAGGVNRKLYDYYVDEENNLVVGEEFNIKGRFKDVYDALESLKYGANRDIQRDRNELIKKQNKLLSTQNQILEEMVKLMKPKE